MRKLLMLLAGGCAVALGGCGTPGAPQPPSLRLPERVTDLRATRKADQVALEWTAPKQTTDEQNIREPYTIVICKTTSPAPQAMQICSSQAKEIAPTSGPAIAEYTDSITPGPSYANYAVETFNPNGRSAGLSNTVSMPLAGTAPAPTDLTAQVTAQGVRLSWQGKPPESGPEVKFSTRVMRQEGENPAVIIGDTTENTFLDNTFQWEKTYQYRVVPITTLEAAGVATEIEGADSNIVTVTTHDVFKPAAPSGVQAVFSSVKGSAGIDLTWSPNDEQDLAGYNVYGRGADRNPVKLNSELVKTPAYRDATANLPGIYTYFVTAVDLRGNESERSQPATEQVPENPH
jgi:hypothetical protein